MSTLPLIRLAVDAIVFGYSNGELSILLVKRKFGEQKGQWALPGGFVKAEEGLSDAVRRELAEETGITVKFLEQLYTFGDDVQRDPRYRVVSVAYFALVDPDGMIPKASTDAADARWCPALKLPRLAFDHRAIIDVALTRLRAKLTYQPVGFELLTAEFPFSDLETLYATILGRDIDRRNFRKKVMALGIVKPTGAQRTMGRGRPAELFRFDRKRYEQLRKKGLYLDLDVP